ncbi:Kinetochore protein Sos7 [Trichoderma lentiforme]|uniref:Kinetochore protein Sos7 n=1 Tax=Trichoderma lentiforme TaxID=1567552 RepID=A0A9P4XEV6_9HYPO|nr:Kinetochore protein Sos7 [Trichoderma lentiforme]
MSAKTPAQVLETLRRLQSSNELSIIKLSESISNSTPNDTLNRISDASNTSLDGPSPTSLDEDLIHYKELFAKLRFSYVEQVTKEKFIRAIVGDPPLIVTLQENLDLERENAEAKAQLKNLKLEVADLVSELEKRGRDLSKRYENIQLETVRLEELPAKIVELESRIKGLKDKHESSESDPNLRLPLTKTLSLVAKRKAEQQELARELEALQAKVPRKRKEAERLQAELQPLEVKRQSSTTAAREARRRKEAALGGVADDLEQRARWYRASESMLKQVLDINT